jgi:hypothetical protein
LLALVGGTLAYDAEMDCFLLKAGGRRYPVVWPAGTMPVAGPAVQLPDGRMVGLGDSVSGGGGRMSGPIPGEFDIPERCLPETGEAVAFNANEQLAIKPGSDSVAE